MRLGNYIGRYKKICVSHAKNKEIKRISTSGGTVTSSLIYALSNKVIDGALVVGMDKAYPWKYEVSIARKKRDIISAAGSKYVKIPISEFLEKIPKKGKYAVVGSPCHIRAIKRVQGRGLHKNIVLFIGLFCGYNMPFKATEYILRKIRVKKQEIKQLRYRYGKYPGGFMVELKNSKKKSFPKHYYDFLNLMFRPKGCLNCRDYTCELADISCGDAWGWNKHSVTIVRSELGKKLINQKHLHIQQINEKQFKRMHWHNIKYKKIGESFSTRFVSWLLGKSKYILPFNLLGLLAKLRRIIIKE